MKSVLISIQPKYCELIASGKKTVEVRKTRPKLETPFKVYIYCTKQGKQFFHGGIGEKECLFKNPDTGKIKFDYSFELMCCRNEYTKDNFLSGKVIGEFVCDEILELAQNENGGYYIPKVQFGYACMTVAEAKTYGQGKTLYGWHISDLVIYDKPRELSEFKYHCRYEYDDDFKHCSGCDYYHFSNTPSNGREEWCGCDGLKRLKRPPQSWCYVERREENDG